MSADSPKKKQETPLCIRFKTGDLARVQHAADVAGQTRSQWVRETVSRRVVKVLGVSDGDGGTAGTGSTSAGTKVPALTYETAHGIGEPLCIRFRPEEYIRVRRAAAKENATVSTWIRACVMHAIGKSEKGRKADGKKSESSKGRNSRRKTTAVADGAVAGSGRSEDSRSENSGSGESGAESTEDSVCTVEAGASNSTCDTNTDVADACAAGTPSRFGV